MNKKEIISVIKITVVALAVVFGANYLYAWTGPTLAPPQGNVYAPLNVGRFAQTKTGGLIVGTNCVLPDCANGLIVSKGNVGIGTLTPQTKLHLDSPDGFRFTNNNNGFDIKQATSETWGIYNVAANKNWYIQGNLLLGGTVPSVPPPGTPPTPIAKLEVAGKVKITGGCDGNSCSGKVLTSDSDGDATWETPSGGGSTPTLSDVKEITIREGSNEISFGNDELWDMCFLTKMDGTTGSGGNSNSCFVQVQDVGSPFPPSDNEWILTANAGANDRVICAARCIKF